VGDNYKWFSKMPKIVPFERRNSSKGVNMKRPLYGKFGNEASSRGISLENSPQTFTND